MIFDDRNGGPRRRAFGQPGLQPIQFCSRIIFFGATSTIPNEAFQTRTFKVVLVGSASADNRVIIRARFLRIALENGSPKKPCVEEAVHTENHQLKLQIWDTSGDERFSRSTSMYGHGAHGFLLVFAPIDQETFDDLDQWFALIREARLHDRIVTVIGRTFDRSDERRVTPNEITAFDERHHLEYIEADSYTRSNLDVAFKNIPVKMFERMLEVEACNRDAWLKEPAEEKSQGCEIQSNRGEF
jgi:signal recognition particle receptor subunit beta